AGRRGRGASTHPCAGAARSCGSFGRSRGGLALAVLPSPAILVEDAPDELAVDLEEPGLRGTTDRRRMRTARREAAAGRQSEQVRRRAGNAEQVRPRTADRGKRLEQAAR